MLTNDAQTEFDSLLPGKSTEQGSTRRTALKVALGVGYAASVMPVVAQTAISTPTDGLRQGQGSYTVRSELVPFYYAAPAGKKDLPVILVVQEIFGVHAYIADVCRRLANAGYLAIAPSLFDRQGDPTRYTDISKLMAEVVAKVADKQVMEDLDGAVEWASFNGGNVNKLAITGFCWGGRIAWLYPTHSARVKAAVAWYGRLVGVPSSLTPKSPVDAAEDIQAPVLGLYGGQDSGISQENIEEMKKSLARAAKRGNKAAAASQFVVYPQAGHGFHADYRPSYNQEAAEDGFARALAWFKANGVA